MAAGRLGAFVSLKLSVHIGFETEIAVNVDSPGNVSADEIRRLLQAYFLICSDSRENAISILEGMALGSSGGNPKQAIDTFMKK